jgi:hypothetical protein
MSNDELRASDADRERVAARLRRAYDEGRIDLSEFDERVAAAYAARTYAELSPPTADLPPERGERVDPSDPGAGIDGRVDPALVGGMVGCVRSGRLSGAARPVGVPRPSRPAMRGWAVARRVESVAWALVGLLNLGIWGLVSVAAGGGVYPWWIWVVGPWGLALLAQHAVAAAVPGRRTGQGR